MKYKHKRIRWIQFGVVVVVVVILIDTIGDVRAFVCVCVLASAHAYSKVLLHQFSFYCENEKSNSKRIGVNESNVYVLFAFFHWRELNGVGVYSIHTA